MATPQLIDTQPAHSPRQLQQRDPEHSAQQPGQSIQSVFPSDFVFQLILEQFWGDGVSKREIRSVYTTAADANAACCDYLLRTWPRDQFTLYEIGASPQRSELSKVSALINGDRFHVWVERHPWKGTLDFSSKAIAKRAGKGPNAYILQRTIKDASGGKRRSTTRGIFATRQLAKEALVNDQPPSEWSSNQGYVLEPGGEYAHALSPTGKTAWLFIEVRPLYMCYIPLEQELQDTRGGSSSLHLGTSPFNPISLDHADDGILSIPSSPSNLLHPSIHQPRAIFDSPFSPIPSNPDEAGAFVYLVLQLKTIPYTPPILTVEAVAYEMDVANRFGIRLLEEFGGPGALFEPIFREDGCFQGVLEQRTRDEGLTVWVEKRAVVIGDESLDFDLVSDHGSVQLNRMHQDIEHRSPTSSSFASPSAVTVERKRGEPQDGFNSTGRLTATTKAQDQAKVMRLNLDDEDHAVNLLSDKAADLAVRYKVIKNIDYNPKSVTGSEKLKTRTIIDTSEDLSIALVSARVEFYGLLANLDKKAVEIKDNLDAASKETKKERTIEACSRSNPALVLLRIQVEDSQE
ncbi:hypothetical protein BX616_008870 [Lobosporangium transversale]|uniref:Uncharacterized protein n=1 Tax=Lobosporangium transversale TaxID=64571 RepID=A0A1Y2GYY7_9FUNG|nr:hypothetical protein BCR41DRAFT_346862 [Lobosporangium transversale]KAF9918430.1 hypothetical protein BX616_008870 [Lobosporangium transversale]ORZ27486.1 hypothetical protein BCR41DRAFT_346862 [Lobosporangium transversale]|eukprot:XP_021885213.1 hypothetical protein BCR41DRAFT_346862 [Lobosporangium transversale]